LNKSLLPGEGAVNRYFGVNRMMLSDGQDKKEMVKKEAGFQRSTQVFINKEKT
jgi:hypothetical protein